MARRRREPSKQSSRWNTLKKKDEINSDGVDRSRRESARDSRDAIITVDVALKESLLEGKLSMQGSMLRFSSGDGAEFRRRWVFFEI